MSDELNVPFPYFGGKSRVLDIVWPRFGDVKNYVEPFAGSLAMLLGRPHYPWPDTENRIETANDLNAFVANFWRACARMPDVTAFWADQPTSELDLHARGDAIFYNGCKGFDDVFRTPKEFIEKLRSDPNWFDPKIAGWWVWGISNWIGDNWSAKKESEVVRSLPHLGDAGKGVARQLPHLGDAGKDVARQLPHLGNAGKGVARKLPHLGDAGRGVARQLPHLGDAGKGVARKLPHLGNAGKGECARHLAALQEWFGVLADRLRHVRLCCGDWQRVCGPSVLTARWPCGVFLDPPYSQKAGLDTVYGAEHDPDVSEAVRKWAIEWAEHKDFPGLRIALCGYEGEHVMPDSWECVAWKTHGGYGNQGNNSQDNAHRERIWFSPGCLKIEPEVTLFDELRELCPQAARDPDGQRGGSWRSENGDAH